MNVLSNVEASQEGATCEEIIHGGDLDAAARRYGIPKDEWIDLSTGLNPCAYPVANIPAHVFAELPYLRDEFINAAKTYYDFNNLLAVNGTQMAIQVLPRVLKKVGVLLPSLGYQEHLKHWQQSGQVNEFYDSSDETLACEQIDQSIKENSCQHLLIINPNNPSGLLFSVQQINQWANALNEGCYVVVDEAFMDLTPHQSVLGEGMAKNIIVLRSFGKFFGLAGIRLGFVLSKDKVLLKEIENKLGLWSVNGPAQHIATQALQDVSWQQETINRLPIDSEKNKKVFSKVFLSDDIHLIKQAHTGLFSSYWLEAFQAYSLYDFFARNSILLRLIFVSKDIKVIRIGLHDRHKVGRASIEGVIEKYLEEIANH